MTKIIAINLFCFDLFGHTAPASPNVGMKPPASSPTRKMQVRLLKTVRTMAALKAQMKHRYRIPLSLKVTRFSIALNVSICQAPLAITPLVNSFANNALGLTFWARISIS